MFLTLLLLQLFEIWPWLFKLPPLTNMWFLKAKCILFFFKASMSSLRGLGWKTLSMTSSLDDFDVIVACCWSFVVWWRERFDLFVDPVFVQLLELLLPFYNFFNQFFHACVILKKKWIKNYVYLFQNEKTITLIHKNHLKINCKVNDWKMLQANLHQISMNIGFRLLVLKSQRS